MKRLLGLARRAGDFQDDEAPQPSSLWHERIPRKSINKNLLIIPGQQIVYMSVPKAACSTLKLALWRSHLGDPDFLPPGGAIHGNPAAPFEHPVDHGFDDFMKQINSADWFRFAFVRNPYSRLVSCYLNKLNLGTSREGVPAQYAQKLGLDPEQPVTFDQFIHSIAGQSVQRMNEHWRIQTETLLWGEIRYDFIGRFENLTDEVARLAASGLDLRPYLRDRADDPKATGANDRVAEFFSAELQELVVATYRADFELLGYDTALPTG